MGRLRLRQAKAAPGGVVPASSLPWAKDELAKDPGSEQRLGRGRLGAKYSGVGLP